MSGEQFDGYLPGQRYDFGVVVVIALFGVIGAALYSFAFIKPTPPPPASDLQGCFVADDAPELRFDGRMLHFAQQGARPMGYKLALEKYGPIVINTDEAVTLEPLGSRYVYTRGEQRTIMFRRPAHLIERRSYGVRHVSDAEYLEVLTPGANDIIYHRVSCD